MTKEVNVVFVCAKTKERRGVCVPEGCNILEAARIHDIDLEGACEGSLACATCHVKIPSPWFEMLPPKSLDEEDMLDMAMNLGPQSRLGCQVSITKDMEGMVINIEN